MANKSIKSTLWKRPALLALALLLILAMLRLGVWQLDRASQKQVILDEQVQRSKLAAVSLSALDQNGDDLRFRRVEESGFFLPEKTIFVDRQVVNGKVGYQVFTPFVTASEQIILIARGWVSVGESRQVLPSVETPPGVVELIGRLNNPPPQPPLWSDQHDVFDGLVWQYLPLDEYAQQMQLNLFPLVLELAPETKSPVALEINWSSIDDKWVGKHKAYAFQWFAMALAMLAISVIMLVRSNRSGDQ